MGQSVLRAFLFTDLVGSTAQWDSDPDAMSAALARHDTVVNDAVTGAGGAVFKHTGDGMCATFDSPVDAVVAAVAIQRALVDDALLSLRMGVHVGSVEPRDGDWFGAEVNRAARVMGIAHGGQILVSGPAAAIVAPQRVEGFEVERVGMVRLRGIAEPEDVHQVIADGLRRAFPPVAGQAIDTLPRPRTSFLGRDREIGEVSGFLDEDQVVTLAGVGGTGKTRLAIEVALRSVDRFPGGVMFAGLADVGDSEGLVDALCEASGVSSAGYGGHRDDRRKALVRALTVRRGLLVVDNCEHLVDPVADLVDDIVGQCPDMRVLATSREPLGVAGEHVVRVGALDDGAALELMTARARSAGPGFVLSDADRDLAVELCRRLDGLPLAIELASARLRAMSLTEVTARLDDRFRLLAGRGRTHDRHATVRATLDWSFDLLEDHEQVLLARLSVFSGGFDLDAVETVCGRDPLDPNDVIDLLIGLVDKSLVVTSSTGAVTRYTMLETVRAYAADHLATRGETPTLHESHAEWVTQRAIAIWLTAGDDQLQAIARLLRDVDNARAAHTWALDTNHPDAALGIAAALARGWLVTGDSVEGLRRCEQALELDGGDATARLLCTVMGSYAARWAATYELAWQLALDALAQNGNATLVPEFELWSALTGAAAVHPGAADPSFETCVARMRELASNQAQRAFANFHEGIYCLRIGDPGAAIPLFEAASALDVSLPDNELYRVCWLATARLHAEGDAQLPPGLLDRIRASGDLALLVLAYLLAAELAAASDQPFADLMSGALGTARDIGLPPGVLAEGLAAVALRADNPRAAARLLGRGQGRDVFAITSTVALRRLVGLAVGDADFELLLAEGPLLSDDELLTLALGLDDR